MTPPTWQELSAAGRVLVDRPEIGLAIYPTTYGNVVIAVREGHGGLHLVCMRHPDVAAVVTALADAEARAQVAQGMILEQESALAAFHLIQRAKGSA